MRLSPALRTLPLLLFLPLPGAAPATAEDPVDAALAWLADQQRDDGAFPYHAYVLQALSQAGPDPFAWPTRDRSVIDTFRPPDATWPESGWSSNLWATHALASNGYDPRTIGPVDLVERIRDGFGSTEFGATASVTDDMWAILALTAAGVPPGDGQVQAAATRVKQVQNADGGWSWSPSTTSAGDETGWGVAALDAAGALDALTAGRARTWLEEAMGGDGSYGAAGVGANCQSTAWALHARAVLGMEVPPASIDYLLSCRHASGGFMHKPSSGRPDVWVTADVLPVVAGRLMPWPGLEFGPVITGPTKVPVGSNTTWRLEGAAGETTWDVDGGRVVGPALQWTPAAPGLRRIHVHARDDATLHRSWHDVTVTNAPPILGPLPATAGADRATPFRLTLAATDPEGFPVSITWAMAGATGEGDVEMHMSRLGTFPLDIVASDPHGGSRSHGVAVTVHNLVPRITALDVPAAVAEGGAVRLAIEASDPDGPAPVVTWRIGLEEWPGAVQHIRLPPGRHHVQVVVTDADGAIASRGADIQVQKSSVPDPGPPRIDTFLPQRTADLLHGTLSFTPVGAQAALSWTTPEGTQSMAVGPGPFEFQVGPHMVSTVRLEVLHAGQVAEAEAGPFAAVPASAADKAAGGEAQAPESGQDSLSGEPRWQRESGATFVVPLFLVLLVLGARRRLDPPS